METGAGATTEEAEARASRICCLPLARMGEAGSEASESEEESELPQIKPMGNRSSESSSASRPRALRSSASALRIALVLRIPTLLSDDETNWKSDEDQHGGSIKGDERLWRRRADLAAKPSSISFISSLNELTSASMSVSGVARRGWSAEVEWKRYFSAQSSAI